MKNSVTIGIECEGRFYVWTYPGTHEQLVKDWNMGIAPAYTDFDWNFPAIFEGQVKETEFENFLELNNQGEFLYKAYLEDHIYNNDTREAYDYVSSLYRGKQHVASYYGYYSR